MKSSLAWWAAALLFSTALAPAACDGDDETTASATTTSSTTTSSTTTASVVSSNASTGSTGGAGTGGAGGSTGEGGSAGEPGVGGSGGTGPNAVVPSLTGTSMFINCQPIVSNDPVHGSYTALYDNTAGTSSGTANIVSSTLHMVDGNQSLNWTFAVTPNNPAAVVPAGQTQTLSHSKTANSGNGAGMGTPCDYCGGSWTLEVTWSVGSQQFMEAFGPEPVSCVF